MRAMKQASLTTSSPTPFTSPRQNRRTLTFAFSNRIDIHVLARQMGTSIGILEKHYRHLIPSLAAEQLAGKRLK